MENQVQEMKVTTADPSALGLFGLAMVTLVASTEKLGWTSGLSNVLPWAIFLGAGAQLVACLNDIKRNNTFGATAFGAFAFFWLAVGMTWMIKMGVLGTAFGAVDATGAPVAAAVIDGRQFGVAFIGYLIFTLYMTIGAMETNKALFIIFVLIDFLFVGLAMKSLGIIPAVAQQIAGWSELAIALMSFYASAASVLNIHFGKVFIPVGKPFGIFKK